MTPVKGTSLKNPNYTEEVASRGVDTAATDTNSMTTTTDRKRTAKSFIRRKRKNMNKKLAKIKKNSKSSTKVGTE